MSTSDVAAAYEAYYQTGGNASALKVNLRVKNTGNVCSALSVLAFVLPIDGGVDAPVRALVRSCIKHDDSVLRWRFYAKTKMDLQ